MNIAYYLIIVLHLLACFFLIGVVLLQQGKSQDLASAFGGGGTQAAFGPRGSANVLTKATAILAGVFVVTSLALSMLRPKVPLGPGPGPGATHTGLAGGRLGPCDPAGDHRAGSRDLTQGSLARTSAAGTHPKTGTGPSRGFRRTASARILSGTGDQQPVAG